MTRNADGKQFFNSFFFLRFFRKTVWTISATIIYLVQAFLDLREKQKPRKSRLSISSTKGEENRIESNTALNQKLRKSKPQKSRNACNIFEFELLDF